MRRVVVTGIGVFSPGGLDKNEFWGNIVNGRSAITLVENFDVSKYPCRIAGEIKNFDPADHMDRREAKKVDRFTQLAVAAALQAWQDSGLDRAPVNREEIGVMVGSGIGGVRTIEEQLKVLWEKGPRRVSPFLVPALIANMASGFISITLGLKGPNSTVVTACATSTHAIGEAWHIIGRGDADIMLAGGAEAAISDLAFSGFSAARAFSTRNEQPEKASRPFDRDRDGFVMGEGAGIIIMEALDSALARQAAIYGEIIGYGMSGDAYHITAPDPDGTGAFLCMRRALRSAGVRPEEIDYVNAHGTSTESGDISETMAIKKLFGAHAYKLKISSTKSMIGHLLGAAGAVEMIATLLTMQHGVIPPTINQEHPDPECDLDYVPNRALDQPVNLAISNSFGFGGTNASLVVSGYRHEAANED